MRAAVVETYGPPEVVAIREVETPVPKPDEIVVRVRATTVNSGDSRVRALRLPRGMGTIGRLALGFSGPRMKVLGFDAAGEVASIGSSVSKFTPGDRVLVSRGFGGCHAEFVAIKQAGTIVPIPAAVGDEAAVALCFGGETALEFFRCGEVKAGERLLVNGASGAVGALAVQIARHKGLEVTAVCSAANADTVRALGASRVIDYAREDFTRSGETWDLVMDNVGNAPYRKVKPVLNPGGRLLMVVGDLGQTLEAALNKQIVTVSVDTPFRPQHFAELLALVASGAIRPVIDSTYPFERIVEAHRRVDSGRKVGSVVVTLAG